MRKLVSLLAVSCVWAALSNQASAQAGLRLTQAPADAISNVGGAASFRVVVEAASPVSYQWLHDDQPLPAATSDTLIIPSVTNADAGRYQVIARTSTASLTAGPATLTLKPRPSTPIVDPTFHGDAALTGIPTVLLPLADQRVLLATTNVISSWDYTAHADVFRLLADGRLDPGFRPGRAMGEEFPRNTGGAIEPPATPTIRQLLVQPDGRILVLGTFSFFNGVACNGIVRLNADGTLDETFVPAAGTATVFSPSAPAALQSDGKILLLASSVNQGNQLVRLEADGRRDPTFVAPSPLSPLAFAQPSAFALARNGRIFVGSGSPLQGGSGRIVALLPDGQLDATFAPYTCDPVQRLYALDNGNVIGTTQYDRGPIIFLPGGTTSGPRFPMTTFRLRSDGSPDPTFVTRALLLTTPPAPDGSLFLNGKLIAPDGITETTPNFGVPSEPQPVNAFTFGPDGRLWVTGRFSFFNGVTSSRVARLNVVASENLAPPHLLRAWADKSTLTLNEPTTLHVAAVGEGPLTYTWLWPFNSGVFAVTNEPSLTVTGSTAGESFAYSVRVANTAGAVTSEPITITTVPGDLRIISQPRRVSLTSGRRGTMSVALNPEAQFNFSEWRRNGEVLQPDLGGSVGPFLYVGGTTILFGPVLPEHAGTYTVTFRDKLGHTATSDPIVVTVDDSARFTNLSTRAQVGPGEQAAILGFVIPPGQSRRVLLRGIGPGLANFGVSGVLADPRLDLYDSAGRVLQRNNGWQVIFTSNSDFLNAGAFPLASGSRDTALLTELQPGSYTVRLASLTNASGAGLIELYEDDMASDRLFNVSSRVFVGAGTSGAAIAGFAIRGPVGKRVLVRAAGPALSAFNIGGPLADPTLEIRDEQGNLVIANDDWQSSSNAAAIGDATTSVGAFPFAAASKDAALFATLPAGNYSAVVTGKQGATGIALIEVYEVP